MLLADMELSTLTHFTGILNCLITVCMDLGTVFQKWICSFHINFHAVISNTVAALRLPGEAHR